MKSTLQCIWKEYGKQNGKQTGDKSLENWGAKANKRFSAKRGPVNRLRFFKWSFSSKMNTSKPLRNSHIWRKFWKHFDAVVICDKADSC